MGYRGVLAGTLLVGLLGACAAVDSTIQPRYDTFNRQLERARNEAILLNIVRAAHDWPLSFATVSQVTPSFTNSTTLGSPSFLIGPTPHGSAAPPSPGRDVIFGNQNNLSNGTTISTSFNVAPNEDHDFYEALLRPVDLHILSFFIRQGYSRELLFWLFADSIEVGPPAKSIGFQYNPPYDFGCNQHDTRDRCVREWAEIAVLTGLTVEEQKFDKGGDGGGGDSKGGKAKGKGKSKGGDGDKTVEVARFCFSSVLADRGMRAMDPARVQIILQHYMDPGLSPMSFQPRCGTPWNPATLKVSGDILSFAAGSRQFRIVPRSAYGIFQFLGKIMNQSMRPTPPAGAPFIPPGEEMLPQLSTIRDDHRLLNVVLNAPEDCFVDTQFIEGTYCVPEHNSANTKRIFGLLTQLIALQTTASDLAITPAVRVIQ